MIGATKVTRRPGSGDPQQKTYQIAIRYNRLDLELIETAREIMGQTVSQFTRSASVALARAILEASATSGIRHTSWERSWIEGSLERKP